MGDLADMGSDHPGQARLILNPHGDKWKYLWAYNTDHKILAMWRVSDGDEKHHGSASADAGLVLELDRKKQLNRVTDSQFRQIDKYMHERAKENLEALKKYLKDNETNHQKVVNDLSWEYYHNFVEPTLTRKIKEGVMPFGFKPNPRIPKDTIHQAITFLISHITMKDLTTDAVDKYLKSKGVDVDYDSQASHWAVNDIRDELFDKYLR
jgi:hypothetical protein